MTPQPLDATAGTDARWTVTVTWPAGWETQDLALCPAMAWAAKERATDADSAAVLGPLTLGAGITVASATTATLAVAAADWPSSGSPSPLVWGLVARDAQGRETQVARGTIAVSPRIPRDVP